MTPRVAIITVSFNHARFLAKWAAALSRLDYPSDAVKVFLVDNASADDTVEVAQSVLHFAFPSELIRNSVNTGFTGGNNLAIRRALAEGFDYVFLLNPDTRVTPAFLTEAIAVAESDPKIGASIPASKIFVMISACLTSAAFRASTVAKRSKSLVTTPVKSSLMTDPL